MTHVFVSYNFNDREIVHSINSMHQEMNKRSQVAFVFVQEDCSKFGDNAIDREIRHVMQPCDSVLFVIGDNNHNSPWIDREAQLAISMGKHIVLTRLPGTYGAPPTSLRNKHEQPWKAVHINQALLTR